jgi:YVTN family beta-propeller protein
VAVGEEPRSLAIASDGLTLYVVDYDDDEVKALAASDLSTLQTVPTGVHPIGVTYDDTTGSVWVAVYTGDILVLSGASKP